MTDTAPVRAFLEERHVAFAAEAAVWAARLPPPPADDASARIQARELLEKVGRAGWLPPPDLRSAVIAREALAARSTLADAVYALQCLGSTPLEFWAAPPLRDRWLPAAAKGEAMAAFAMTEPEAGSDVAAIRTTARRDGDAYVIEGRKTLISNAGIADFYTVFASTDPAAGKKGLSCFVVDARDPGVRFVKAQTTSVPHPLGEVTFEGCRGALVGEEGKGLHIGMATLDRLRPTVGAAACGMAARALAEAVTHARERRQFGKPLAEQQIIREKIARMATDLAASRLLVYRAAWQQDTGLGRITVEGSMAKAFATEAAQRIVDDAVQVLGGVGVLAEQPVERLYRAVRALRIYEGTTEIQHLLIARHILGREP